MINHHQQQQHHRIARDEGYQHEQKPLLEDSHGVEQQSVTNDESKYTGGAHRNYSDELKRRGIKTSAISHPSEIPVPSTSEQSQSTFSRKNVATRENWTVRRLRWVVLAAFVAATSAVATIVFVAKHQAQRDRFEEAFLDASSKLFESIGRTFYGTLGDVDTFTLFLTLFAREAGMQWPFVTFPDYAETMEKFRARSNVAVFNQFNLVQDNTQRKQWEAYTKNHYGWVEEGLKMQEQGGSTENILAANETPQNFEIQGPGGGPIQGSGPFLPNWQESPVIPGSQAFNWDFSTVYEDPHYFNETIYNQRVVIAKVWNMPASRPGERADDKESSDSSKDTKDQATQTIEDFIDYLDPTRDPTEPLSDILYPIVAKVPSLPGGSEVERNKSVGIMIATVFWSDLIRDVLPIGTNGINFIFENPCGQTFSYQIDGPSVKYMGSGDFHDTEYDDMVQKIDFDDLIFSPSTKAAYTGLPLSTRGCPFHLRAYPSAASEKDFLSSDPLAYTAIVLALFGILVGLFKLYDYYVEKRLNLFLNELRVANNQLTGTNKKLVAASTAQLKHFACMSHEIRTPLNCIIGVTSLLQSSRLDHEQKESVNMISTSSDLLLTVVNDVLDYSKLVIGDVDVDIRPTRLQEVLNSVVQTVETNAKQQGVSLRTYYGTNVGGWLSTDSQRFQQILYNTLGNAVKFSQPRSHVDLSISIGDPYHGTNSKVFYSPIDDRVAGYSRNASKPFENVMRLSVKNYGRGLSLQDCKKIFQPFEQVREKSRMNVGTGLGLPITCKLVHRLGGRIYVESEDNEWVEFSMEFPVSHKDICKAEDFEAGLAKGTFFLVCDKPGVVSRMTNVFDAFSIALKTTHSIDCVYTALDSLGSSSFFKRNLVLLVDEDCYNKAAYKKIQDVCAGRNLVSMISFGSHHRVEDSQIHFRSLVRLLPAVLMEHASVLAAGAGIESLTWSRSSLRNIPTAGDAHTIPYTKLRILVAEDNIVNQKVLGRMLRHLGVKTVDFVDDGDIAVQREAEVAYDVVLMDMEMPRMDGLEACKLICARNTTGSLDDQPRCSHPIAKVLFVTAHVTSSFEDECYVAGASGELKGLVFELRSSCPVSR